MFDLIQEVEFIQRRAIQARAALVLGRSEETNPVRPEVWKGSRRTSFLRYLRTIGKNYLRTVGRVTSARTGIFAMRKVLFFESDSSLGLNRSAVKASNTLTRKPSHLHAAGPVVLSAPLQAASLLM